MSTITVKDGTTIYYKDWGSGQPIVFSHGWPLSADDWDTQMLFFLKHGYRVIAHDRRGHGRSSQTGDGHDMDHYADDLAALTEHLNLKDAIHVGHSSGRVAGGRLRGLHFPSLEHCPVFLGLLHCYPPVTVGDCANHNWFSREKLLKKYRETICPHVKLERAAPRVSPPGE
jgi:non-heme chloroperoxidase